MDGVVKTEFFKPKNIGYPEEFKKMIVDESGEALKMKKIIIDQNASFNEYMIKGDEFLNEKKYDEAKLYYEKALGLKPDDENLKSKIDNIKSLLSSIEKLHKSTF